MRALAAIFLVALLRTAYAQSCGITPSFSYTIDAGCGVPRQVSFINTSTGSNSNNQAYYIWMVNGIVVDSTYGTSVNGKHFLSASGTYTFALEVHRVGSTCVDTVSIPMVFFNAYSPKIYDGNTQPSYQPVFSNCIINVSNNNDTFDVFVSSPDTLTNYRIIWGDGKQDNVGSQLLPNQQILHRYEQLGLYQLAIISNSPGCTDTLFGEVRNLRPPNTSISVLPGLSTVGCGPFTIIYKDSSTNVFPGTTLIWNFGIPGSTFIRNETRANDTIIFTFPAGTTSTPCPQNVSLTISNKYCGTPITVVKSGEVQLYNKSKASFILPPAPFCNSNLTYTFINNSINNCVGGDRYFWRTADTTFGWTTNKAPITIKFKNFGNQTITLLDSNTCGVDSMTTTIFLNSPPVANFSISPKIGCSPIAVNFVDSSVGLNMMRTWNFIGNSQPTDTARNVTRNYTTSGVFPVQLTVSNNCTPSAIVRDTIRVFTKPTAIISGAVNGCAPYKLKLYSSSINVSPWAKYYWDFGNGDTAIGVNTDTVTYINPGTYNIRLVVHDTCGIDTQIVTIKVGAKPIASFTSNTVCKGDTTQLINTSILSAGDTITSYKWYFHNGDSSVSNNPKYIYSNHGTYNVILQIITDKNCIAYDTGSVVINPTPEVNFNYTPNNICYGQIVSFDGTASTITGTISSRKWKFTSTDSAVVSEDTVFNFPSPGTYLVTFSAINSIGCSSSITQEINIRPLPVVRISSVSGCETRLTTFKDSSFVLGQGNYINKWEWDLNNDGLIDDTIHNPSYIFPITGTYKIKLRVGTNYNCYNTDSFDVLIYQKPTAAISQSHTERCALDSFTFINNSLGATLYRWNFGNSDSLITNSLSDVRYAYPTHGNYSVRMVAVTALGCTDTAWLNIVSRPLPKASFTVNDSAGCAPKLFTFNNTSLFSDSYQWFVNNSLTHTNTIRPDTLVMLSGQVFNVKLVAQNIYGCKPDTANLNLKTFDNPTANFTISKDSGCGPLPVTFINTSIGANSYLWNLGNGATLNSIDASTVYLPSVTNDSIYNIKLLVATINGCKDSITKQVRVFPIPKALFTANTQEGCGPLQVNFTNQSIHNYGGTIDDLLFNWDLGNDSIANTKNTQTKYLASLSKDTIYNARLIVTTKYGCKDSTQRQIRVYPNPKAAFIPSQVQGCGPLTVNFLNISIPNDTGTIAIMTFQWNFSNGSTSTQVNQTQTFHSNPTKDTIYTVKLIAYSEHGCVDSTYQNILVFPKPLSRFTVSDTFGCAPYSPIITNTSIPHDTGTINDMNFIWNFGNGQMSFLPNPNPTYLLSRSVDSIFKLTLIAISEHGCRDTSEKLLHIFPRPSASITANVREGCGPLPVQFNSTSTAQLTAFYKWYFDDGDSSELAHPLHIFKSINLYDRIYKVKMIAISAVGCASDTGIINITTLAKPSAKFTSSVDTTCGSTLVVFNNQSQSALNYSWNFSNGITSSFVNPVIFFNASNENDTQYTVTMVADNAYGCLDTATHTITLHPIPKVDFIPSTLDGCGPLGVQFTNTSQHKSGGSISDMIFNWNLGNGTNSTLQNPSNTYVASIVSDSIYQVKLIGTSKYGCKDSATKNIRVYPNATAEFFTSASDGCGPLPIQFFNQSRPNDTGSIAIMTFKWSFGDGTTSTQTYPQHTFLNHPDKDTVYTIKLLAYSEHGCPDSTIRQVRVYPKPLAQFVASDTSACGPTVVHFTNQSSPRDTGDISIMSFIWDLGNAQSSTHQDASTLYLPNTLNTATYTARLIAISEHACRDTATQLIRIHPKPIVSVTPDKTTGCTPLNIHFNNNTLLASSFIWYFGDGDSSDAKNPNHIFNAPDMFDSAFIVKMIATTPQGCKSDTLMISVVTRGKPIADFIASNDSICGGGNISFYNTSLGGFNSMWNFGNGNTSTAPNPIQTFVGRPLFDTVYNIQLVITSPYQCRDTIIKQVKLNALPALDIQTVQPGCTPYNVNFINNTPNASHFEWYFGDGTTDTLKNPHKTFFNNKIFNNEIYNVLLRAYTPSGCSDTISKTVVVHPKPLSDFNSFKTSRCDTVEFRMVNLSKAAVNFIWDLGNNQTSFETNPIMQYYSLPNRDTSYAVRLISENVFGCRDTIYKEVRVSPKVHANFSSNVTSGCNNTFDINFENHSVNAQNYLWHFGDGTTSYNTSPIKRYYQPGVYTVKLIAFDTTGCSDTAILKDYIEVYDVPEANFSYNPQKIQLPNANVNFIDLSRIAKGNITHYWSFGDGVGFSTVQNPSYTYIDSGYYTVKLITTSDKGCRDTTQKQIYVITHQPIPDFTTSTIEGCSPLTVQFYNNSQYADEFIWHFGDAARSTASNPTHTYITPSTYNVTLYAKGRGGDSTIIKTDVITVRPSPYANFNVSPKLLVLPRANTTLTDLSNDAVKWNWRIINEFNQSIFESNLQHPEYEFQVSGKYTVQLVVQNTYGCFDTLLKENIINVLADGKVFVPTAFTPNGDGINERFKPILSGVSKENYRFTVYNRWGEKVFETHDVNDSWDGTFNGVPAQMDVYIWVVEGLVEGDIKFSQKGSFTLIR